MKGKSLVPNNPLHRAWRGKERLWKIYWGYLFLGSAILMIASTIIVGVLSRVPLLGRIAGVYAIFLGAHQE